MKMLPAVVTKIPWANFGPMEISFKPLKHYRIYKPIEEYILILPTGFRKWIEVGREVYLNIDEKDNSIVNVMGLFKYEQSEKM